MITAPLRRKRKWLLHVHRQWHVNLNPCIAKLKIGLSTVETQVP